MTTSQLLKQEGAAWVRRATIHGRDVVVKCRPLNSHSRRLKHALRLGHAYKHWRGAKRLARAAIPTGKPILIARMTIDGADSELLVVEFVAGRSLLSVLSDIAQGHGPSVREQHTLARDLGAMLPRLIQAEIYNRDHKPSNLVLLEGDSSERFAIIDCVGIRYILPPVEEYYERMLASLLIEPTGCACPPRRTLQARLVVSIVRAALTFPKGPRVPVRLSEARLLIDDVQRRIRRHGDPRPTHNPLSPPSERPPGPR